MDIIENWNLLNERMKEEKPDIVPELFKIHMGAFDDLRNSGMMLKIGDQTVWEIAHRVDAIERLELAGSVGRNLINADGTLMEKHFIIQLAEHFSNCIFIGLAAIIENLEGGINEMFPEQKMLVDCHYTVSEEGNDPLGELLPILEQCYPWINLQVNKTDDTVDKKDDNSQKDENINGRLKTNENKETDKKGFFAKFFRR